MTEKAEIAVIGGTGFCSLDELQGAREMVIKTPFGDSPEVMIGRLGGRGVAFLPRHGKKHTSPPHLINFRANLWALRELGVKRVFATSTCGSIDPGMRPGDLVLLDQFIDFTKRRPQTFYEGGKSKVVHVDVSEPYCPELRNILMGVARDLKLKIHPRATYGCTEGPRFETAAEIKALRKLGCDLVGMTIVPECVLARELELCYAAIAVVTNLAAGISKKRLTYTEVSELMKERLKSIKELLFKTIPKVPKRRFCTCAGALEGAVVEA